MDSFGAILEWWKGKNTEDVELEDDSSSPRDNLKVTSTRGTRRGKVEITFDDGSSFFVLDAVRRRFGIFEGSTLSEGEMSHLLHTSESEEAEQKAFTLLSAPHSRRNLELKLRQRGFPQHAVDHALTRAQELGYLDDPRYAEDWIQRRLERHPEGRYAILAGLLKKGIDRTLAEECVNRMVTMEVEEECGRRLFDRSPSLLSLPQKKLAAKLSSRGFHVQTIRRLLEELDSEDPGK